MNAADIIAPNIFSDRPSSMIHLDTWKSTLVPSIVPTETPSYYTLVHSIVPTETPSYYALVPSIVPTETPSYYALVPSIVPTETPSYYALVPSIVPTETPSYYARIHMIRNTAHHAAMGAEVHIISSCPSLSFLLSDQCV